MRFRRIRPLGRRKFSQAERSLAKTKDKKLKKARAEFQLLADKIISGKIPRETAAVFKALLRKKGVKRSLLEIASDSLFVSENLRAAAEGKSPKHDISPMDEGRLFSEISLAGSAIKEAIAKGILPKSRQD